MTSVKIDETDLLNLIHYARRYCDGRKTYVPFDFNRIYNNIQETNPHILPGKDELDTTLMDKGKYWPYAQDGNYDPITGKYNAIDTSSKLEEDSSNKLCQDCRVRYVSFHANRFSKRCLPCAGDNQRMVSREIGREKARKKKEKNSMLI